MVQLNTMFRPNPKVKLSLLSLHPPSEENGQLTEPTSNKWRAIQAATANQVATQMKTIRRDLPQTQFVLSARLTKPSPPRTWRFPAAEKGGGFVPIVFGSICSGSFASLSLQMPCFRLLINFLLLSQVESLLGNHLDSQFFD